MPIVLLHDGHLANTSTNGVDSDPDKGSPKIFTKYKLKI
jgi:hypothetical protein